MTLSTPSESDLKKNMAICLYDMATRKSKEILSQVLDMGTPNRDPNKSFLEYLMLEKKMSLSKISSSFQGQRRKLEKQPTNFDVTMLCLCIKHGCDGFTEDKEKKPDTLEHCVISIKNFRNTIVHEVDMDRQTFLVKVEELGNLFIKTLTKAYELYKKQTLPDSILKQLEQEIDDFKNEPFNKEDDGTFLFNKVSEMMKVEGKEELQKKYEEMSSIGPVSNLLGTRVKVHVDKIFTKMSIRKESTDSSEGADQYVEYEELLQCLENRQDHKDNVALLVEGVAGVGKTTLTRKLIRDWASGTMALKAISNYEFAILTECRDRDINSLTQLLSSLMSELSKKVPTEYMVRCIQQNKLLFIVDGLDELNSSSEVLLKQIMKLGETARLTVICTTRPNRVRDFKRYVPENFAIMHMKVIGIEENKREEFVRKYSKALDDEGESDISGLLQYLTRKESRLQDHWKLAFNLVLVTIFWFKNRDIVNRLTTATELFMETHKLCKERLKERLLKHEETRKLEVEEIDKKIDIFMKKLQEEALINHYNDDTVLSLASVERLREICNDLHLPHTEVLGSFLIQADSVTDDRKEKFSFPHKGLQDFFSALHIQETLLAEKLDVRRILSNIETIISDCGVPTDLWRSLREVNKEELEKQKRKVSKISHSIQGVLEETLTMAKAYKETQNQTVNLDLVKCHDVLAHLAGLLYLGGRSLKEDACAELVTLLKSSGTKERSDWLSLLSGVKCDERVSKYIAQAMDLRERIEITDSQVSPYIGVLRHTKPSHVEVDITSDPQDVPRLKELLSTLQAKNWKIDLRFRHDFRYMKGRASDLDESLQEYFQSTKAKVTWLCGRLSGPALGTQESEVSRTGCRGRVPLQGTVSVSDLALQEVLASG
ncbi:uncharacterized protein LOC122246588 [Penaeus japonicus]|uniref:uncharacterized protein LOC122246588 n=1 Tax=Penaeus japonicus TaxID=27405 RepID=UPI001C714239|nr:uncharacterized protein LOC122246588 [Penaeus japonicus]